VWPLKPGWTNTAGVLPRLRLDPLRPAATEVFTLACLPVVEVRSLPLSAFVALLLMLLSSCQTNFIQCGTRLSGTCTAGYYFPTTCCCFDLAAWLKYCTAKELHCNMFNTSISSLANILVVARLDSSQQNFAGRCSS